MQPNSQSRRALVVEDSTAMRELLVHSLRRVPALEVDQAADGVAALKLLRATPPPHYDLVLLDLNMPVMDGMKLLGLMRGDAAYANTTVCVVTTEESAEAEAQARTLGARHFLRKPVNRRSIEVVLDAVFGPR
jgi:two-component system chemotaxis response regulator CheY